MARNYGLNVILNLVSSQFRQGLAAAQGSLRNFQATARGFSAGLSQSFRSLGGFKTLGIVGGIAAIGNEFKKAIQYSIQFEKTLSNLKALTGASSSDMRYYKQAASELGSQFGKTGSEMAETFKIVGSGKSELLKNKEELVAVSAAAITLSKAAGMEVPEAADALVVAMNQFNAPATEANRYINAMAAGAKEGAAEIPNLSNSLVKFGSVANALKIPIEQSIAMIEALSEKGLKDEVAGTGIKTFLLRLEQGAKNTRPSVVGLEQALENLKKMNLSVNEAQEMFGTEAANVALALISQTDRVKQLTTAVTGTNEAYKQAQINGDNVAGSMEKLNASWTNFKENLINSNGELSLFFKNLINGINSSISYINRINKTKGQIQNDKHKDESEYNTSILNDSANISDVSRLKSELTTRKKWASDELSKLMKPENGGYTGNYAQIEIDKNEIEFLNKELEKTEKWLYKNSDAAKKLGSDFSLLNKPNNSLELNKSNYKSFSVAPNIPSTTSVNNNKNDNKKSSNKRTLDKNEIKAAEKINKSTRKAVEDLIKEDGKREIEVGYTIDPKIIINEQTKEAETFFDNLQAQLDKQTEKPIEVSTNIKLLVKDANFQKDLQEELDNRKLQKKDNKVQLAADYKQKPWLVGSDIWSNLDNGVGAVENISNAFENLNSKIKNGDDNFFDYFNTITTVVNGISSAIQMIEQLGTIFEVLGIIQKTTAISTVAAAKVEGTAKLMVNQAVGTSAAIASALALPFPFNLAAAPAAGASATAMFTPLYGLLAFKDGGIVPGSSFTGDNIIARVNSGEMILNGGQQARLFNIINNGKGDDNKGIIGEVKIKGADLHLILSKNDKRNKIMK